MPEFTPTPEDADDGPEQDRCRAGLGVHHMVSHFQEGVAAWVERCCICGWLDLSDHDRAVAADALRQAADVPCRFCHTPASTHDVTSCPRHFYHPEWMLAEGSSDE